MAVHKVTFLPLNRTVEVDDGKYPLADHGRPGSLLDIALANDIHLEHNCGGSCACTTCHVIVREGAENLSEMPLFYGADPTLISNRLLKVTARGDAFTQAWNVHEWEVH